MTNSNTSRFNKAQFEAFYKLHFNFAYNFALQYLGDRGIAQDICQEAFLVLWEKRQQLNPKQSVKSYLFTTIKNRCLNYIRDNKKYRSKVLDLDCGDFDIVVQEDRSSEKELQQKIETALSQLPEKCRKVFEMSRYQNMKYREIAEELSIAQKTVEAHISKAMKSLRQSLKDYFLFLFLFF